MNLSPAPVPAAVDVTLTTFVAEVLEASKQKLVVVDFWATWSGPCKQFGPLLAKTVAAYRGAIKLAKLDIDKNPQIAQQLGVQSVPAVFAFFQGRPVDGFMGAVPEAQLKAWLDRLVKATSAEGGAEDDGIAAALEEGEALLKAGDAAEAQAVYAHILSIEPENAKAFAGVLRSLLALGAVDQAKAALAGASEAFKKAAEVVSVQSAIELAEAAAKTGGDVADLQKKVEAAPKDHQARFDLAMGYYAVGDREKAVDELLEIVRRDRVWNEDGARKQLVKLFEAMGPTDPLTIAARKKLSSLLFA